MTLSRGTILLAAFLLVSYSQTAKAQDQPLDFPIEIILDKESDFIHQDHNRFIWLAFGNQIIRYDGATREIYQNVSSDTTTIGDGYYWSAASTADGTIWLGNFTTGLNRMTGYGGRVERWHAAPDDPRGLTGHAVVRLIVDSAERLWVGTPRGLKLFDEARGSFVHYLHDPADSTSLPGDFIGGIAEDMSGNIWIGTNRGLARYDPESGSFERFTFQYRSEWKPLWEPDAKKQRLPYEHVVDMSIDRTGRIWLILCQMRVNPHVGTLVLFGVPVSFDPEARSFQTFEFIDEGLSVGISSIRQDDAGRLWAATQKGLALFDPDDGTFTRANLWTGESESLGGVQISEMILDRQGDLWISWFGSPSGAGRITLAYPGIEAHSTLDSEVAKRATTSWVDAVVASRDNTTLWLAPGNATGLTRLDRATGRETRYSHDPDNTASLSHDYVREIVEREDGRLWVAGQGGLDLFDPVSETFTHYGISGDRVAARPEPRARGAGGWMDPDNILAIASVSDDELWLAGTRPLFVNVETGAKRSYTVEAPSALRSGKGRVADILISKAGLIWMIVPPGAVRLNPATGESTAFVRGEVEPTTLSVTNTYSVHEDAQGRIWVGGLGGGLNLFEPETETWMQYGHEQGLDADDIMCITHDDLGYVWVSTSNGLSRFDPVTERFETFRADDGVLGLRFTTRACSRSTTGELFFGGEYGFNIVRPDLIPEPPPTILTAVSVSGVRLRSGLDERLPLPLSQTEEVHLSHDENNLSFEYASIDFRHSGSRNFTYRLDPIEVDWQEGGDRNATSYPNLAPGEYTFMVRGSVAGRMSRSPASIRIFIAPPWWETWWAYAAYACLLLAGLVVTERLRRASIVRRERAQALIREAEIRSEVAELKVAHKEEHEHQLEELNEAKSRFLANVSHEFRTPLTLVQGIAQDLLDGRLGPVTGSVRQAGKVVARNAGKLEHLVRQILDLSRIEVGATLLTPSPGDLAECVGNVARAFVPLAERKGVELDLALPSGPILTEFDCEKLETAIGNLISNAVKFTEPGGRVHVSLDLDRKAEATTALVRVCDTGIGISRENLALVFDRFKQADSGPARRYGGVGLGLALARELVQLHGGTIEVESRVGSGSTFSILLPLKHIDVDEDGVHVERLVGHERIDRLTASSPLLELEAGIGESPVGSDGKEESDGRDAQTVGGRATVLVVEDNSDVRWFLRSHLDPLFEVIEASDGIQGLKMARERSPDLVISDIMMPGIDGVELCRSIKDDVDTRSLPVILLTARAGDENVMEGLRAGADVYVEKPFSMSLLKQRVENLLKDRDVLREDFSRRLIVEPAAVTIEGDDEALLRRVLEVAEEHLDDSGFTVDTLAYEIGLSRRQLERRLPKICKETPSHLVRRLRLERSRQLLEAHVGSVAEIAAAAGYRYPSHFSAAFRRRYGVLPSEYRNSTVREG